IARLQFLLITNRGAAGDALEGYDQFVQRNRMRIAEIEYVKGCLTRRELIVDGREHARHSVIDEGVVTTHGAVSEYWDWLAGFHQGRKFPDREIRPLARAVHREEAQANGREVVKMSVSVAKEFS